MVKRTAKALEVRATTTGHEPVRVPASSGDRCARQSTASARRRSPASGLAVPDEQARSNACRPSVAVAGSRRLGVRGQVGPGWAQRASVPCPGTNRLSALYDDTSDYGTPRGGARGRARQWLRVFSERDAECRGRGLRYVQTIIPEKLACHGPLRPFPSPVRVRCTVPGGESRGSGLLRQWPRSLA